MTALPPTEVERIDRSLAVAVAERDRVIGAAKAYDGACAAIDYLLDRRNLAGG